MNAYFMGICFMHFFLYELYRQPVVTDVFNQLWNENAKNIQSVLQKHRYLFLLIPKQHGIAAMHIVFV